MKVLIIGLGSIGRRHLAVLEAIGGIELAALRTRKGTLNQRSSVKEFDNVEDALRFEPDGVIIANPTSMHVESALPFLESGCRVLIEKPISQMENEANALLRYSENMRVAYCMRFLPVSKYFRTELDLDKVFKVSFKRSYYLPKWHPYADYRTEYTAKKNLGGGVIRTLSHELDLACYWLGEPVRVTGVVDQLSHLELDVDDFAFLSMKMKNGSRANLEMDYFSPINVNTGELFNDQGKYAWDANALTFMAYDSVEAQCIMKFEDIYDRMYHDQMIDFLDFIQHGTSVNCNFFEAVGISRIIEDVESQSSYINTALHP